MSFGVKYKVFLILNLTIFSSHSLASLFLKFIPSFTRFITHKRTCDDQIAQVRTVSGVSQFSIPTIFSGSVFIYFNFSLFFSNTISRLELFHCESVIASALESSILLNLRQTIPWFFYYVTLLHILNSLLPVIIQLRCVRKLDVVKDGEHVKCFTLSIAFTW